MGVMLSTLRPNMSQGPGEGTPDTKKVRLQSPLTRRQAGTDEDKFDASCDADIEFIRRLAQGEPLSDVKQSLPDVRHNELLSALHWVGVELNDRVNLSLKVGALEGAEGMVRQQIEHTLEEKEQLLYIEEKNLSTIDLTEDGMRPAITIVTPGAAEVVVDASTVKLKTLVPGSLEIIDGRKHEGN